MDENGNFHTIVATTGATYEVVPLSFGEENKVFPTAPVPLCPFYRTVIVPTLVHLKHIVLELLVPKRCN